jgi:hypothetical protein
MLKNYCGEFFITQKNTCNLYSRVRVVEFILLPPPTMLEVCLETKIKSSYAFMYYHQNIVQTSNIRTEK